MDKPQLHSCCEYSHMYNISTHSENYELFDHKRTDDVYGTLL